MNRPDTQLITPNLVWNFGSALLVVSAILIFLSRTSADPDLWGHVRFGLDMIESGSIPRTDPYSYLSAGNIWINHEWLAEVVFAILWIFLGSTGLVLLKMAVGFLIVGILYFVLRYQGVEPLLSAILILFGLMLIAPAIGSVRPHIFTLLGFAIILLLIFLAAAGKYRLLWVSPLVFVFWPNFHGGFLAGLGILYLWALVHIFFNRDSWIKIGLPLIACLLATLINPYGIGLITFLMETATVARPEVTEWQPVRIVSIIGAFYLALLATSILGLIYTKEHREPALVVVFLACALLPLLAIRHLPLFALGAIILTGHHIRSAWRRGRPLQQGLPKIKWKVALFPGLAGILLLILFNPNFTKIDLTDQFIFPTGIVSLLKESEVSGNLAVDFNWGEYIIWHLGPEVKVSMDGRRETVYSKEIYIQSINYRMGFQEWDQLLTHPDTDMTLVYKESPAYNLLTLLDGWTLIYEDHIGGLFAKEGTAIYDQLRSAATSFSPGTPTEIFP